MAPAAGMARARQSRARDTAGAMAPAGAIALAGPDFEAAGPVFEAAGLDFEAAGLDFGALGTDKDNTNTNTNNNIWYRSSEKHF